MIDCLIERQLVNFRDSERRPCEKAFKGPVSRSGRRLNCLDMQLATGAASTRCARGEARQSGNRRLARNARGTRNLSQNGECERVAEKWLCSR